MLSNKKRSGSLLYRFIKRTFDLISSILLLLLLIPILLISAIFIKIEDHGPVFYLSYRTGLYGKPFKMFKLRSMKINAPDIRLEDGSTYNGDDDPRVTKFGKFARKTSIDELPQIINVFLGHMSFIGPRPDTLIGSDAYTEEEKIILTVKPGITGYNQALNRNSVLTKEKLKNDIYYVNNLSIWFDIKIIFMTIFTVLKRKNINRKEDEIMNKKCIKEKKRIMILGASILQLPAIKKSIELGLEVIAVDMDENAIGFFEPGVVKEVISTIDIPKVVDAAKKYKIDGILTIASDMPIRTVAAVSRELNLVGIDDETAIKATNKYEMRNALKKYNVPIPKYYRVSNEEDYNEVIKKFNGKFIVKPVDNSGSRGIFLVDNIGEARNAFLYSKKNSRCGDILVEEFMEGREVSVETITVDGVCNVIQITDKLTTGAPHFVELGHTQPSQLPDDIKSKVISITIKANEAIGIKNGPSHTEIIITKDGPKIVELGARLGGDCITSHLVPLSTGIDMVECCIRLSLGEKVEINKSINMASAIRYFPQRDGIIKKIEGVEKALEIDGVVDIKILKNIGDHVSNICDSSSRIGFVICVGKTINDVISKCNRVLQLINIEIEE